MITLCICNVNIAEFFWSTMTIRKIVHEGEQISHSEILNQSESISWDLMVEEEFDVGFSIRAQTISSALKSAWTILEPNRVSSSKGEISSSELLEDGIRPPVMIEFVFDNRFSWFNPKQIVLTINRTGRSVPEVHEESSEPVDVQRELSRSSSLASTPDAIERRRADTARAKMDLLWMQQVLTEAVERCPDRMPQLRAKLIEANEILSSHRTGTRSPIEFDASI